MLPLNVIHILTNGFGFNKLDIIMNTYGTNNFGGENLHASFSDFIIGDKVSHLKFKKFKVHHILVKIHFSFTHAFHINFSQTINTFCIYSIFIVENLERGQREERKNEENILCPCYKFHRLSHKIWDKYKKVR